MFNPTVRGQLRDPGRCRCRSLIALILLPIPLLNSSAIAQDQAPLAQPITRLQARTSDLELPANTAIVGRVLLDIVLDPNRKYALPVTMLTALPVYDSFGTAVIPENTLITAIIQKQDGGDYITIDRVVYRGLNIPLPSEGRLIPAQVKPENYSNYIIPPKSKASSVIEAADQSALVSTLLAVAIASSYNSNQDGSQNQSVTPLLLGILGLDVGIKIIAALFDHAPKPLPPLVEIPKDSLIVFTLKDSVQLPSSSAPATAMPTLAQ